MAASTTRIAGQSTLTPTTEGAAGSAGAAQTRAGSTLWQEVQRERWMYLFIIPGALYFLVFEYLPLLGNVIAFQNFSPFLGITGSPFIGVDNFSRLLTDADCKLALANTLIIELLQLVFAFPAPLILALVLNSLLSD